MRSPILQKLKKPSSNRYLNDIFKAQKVREIFLALLLISSIVVSLLVNRSEPVVAQQVSQTPNSKPSIVLVHGALADGSSWQHVILTCIIHEGKQKRTNELERRMQMRTLRKQPQINDRRTDKTGKNTLIDANKTYHSY